MAQRILSNNQINILGLWQRMIERLYELEEVGGLKRVEGQFFSDTHVKITIADPNLSEEVRRYTIGLNPFQHPLYVQWRKDEVPQPQTYRPTCEFLRHVIKEIEKAIMWQRWNNEQASYREEGFEEEPEVVEFEDEVCPCGHPRSQHYMEEAHCEAHGCDCPQFGEPVENYETYTKVWFTEPPGGHYGYE